MAAEGKRKLARNAAALSPVAATRASGGGEESLQPTVKTPTANG